MAKNGFSQGFVPERGSQLQYDLVSSLAGSAMQSAGGTGSPILAALTPMLTGAALSRATANRNEAEEARLGPMSQALFGRDLSPQEQTLMQIMSSTTAPDFFQDEATRQLRAMLAPRSGAGGAGGGGAAADAPSPPADDLPYLLGVLSGDTNRLTDSQQAQLLAILRDPEATSQARQWAQERLSAHMSAPPFPQEVPAAPTAPQTEIAEPFMPPVGGPARPPSGPSAPPPPPNTQPL